jgi:predicted nucleic acid-binding protein
VVLVDSSDWIATFALRPSFRLDDVVSIDEVVTCQPVIQEILQGFANDRAYRTARDAMLALPCLESPLSMAVVEEAVGLFRSARRAGVTVRSSIDCLIAAMALRHGITVLHRDRDYRNLARVSALKERSV